MTNNRRTLLSKLRRDLEDRSASDKLWGSMTRARESRSALVEKIDLDLHSMKQANRTIKTKAIADIKLIDQFSDSIRKNGGQVFFAHKGEDAIQYVLDICERTGTKIIVKSKSLTSDEIEFTKEVEKKGIRC